MIWQKFKILRFLSELKDYFLLALLKHRQDYKMGTKIPVRAQSVEYRAPIVRTLGDVTLR